MSGDYALPGWGTAEGLLAMKAPTRFRFTIETEAEADGRWLAEIAALPGVLAYGSTREEVAARAKALALRVLAERLERGEPTGELGPRMLARIAKHAGLRPEDL
jgi:predicted RNase H-like HicB family nuclease